METVIVHPKPGVTLFLPGSSRGFVRGPVPMRADQAASLGHHLVTDEEMKAAAAAPEASPADRG